MASYFWQGVSGHWRKASNWTPAGGPPTSADSATINGASSDTITVNLADDADSLTLSDANATLDIGGALASLTIGGALTVSNGALNVSRHGHGGVLTAGALNLSGGSLYIGSGGDLDLNGTLSQTGGTLTLNGGTISGGTIDATGGALNLEDGTLSGLTFDGPLNLEVYAAVALADGTKVVGSSGSGTGTIDLTAPEAHLYFDGTQTLSNTIINLGAPNYSSPFDEIVASNTGVNEVLTLASGVTINAQGYAEITSGNDAGDGIVNEGLIRVGQTSYGFYIEPNAFTNSGTIDVEDGGHANIDPTTFTTTSSSVMDVDPSSFLTIDPTNSWSNLGSITLNGASLTIDGDASDEVDNQGVIDQTGGGGNIEILPGAFTNSGVIEAGAMNGSVAIDSGTFANSGSLDVANGDAVTVSGAVAGKGTDTISGGAGLEFDAAVSSAATSGDQDIGFSTGGGTLDLLAPASFYGEISDFGTGDTVELKGSWAFSAISQSGGITTLTLVSGSTTHGFEFAGDYRQSNFSISPGTTTKIGYS